jgi:hypothetical protein
MDTALRNAGISGEQLSTILETAAGGGMSGDLLMKAFETDQDAFIALAREIGGNAGSGFNERFTAEVEGGTVNLAQMVGEVMQAAQTGMITTHEGFAMITSEGMSTRVAMAQMAGYAVTSIGQMGTTADNAAGGPFSRLVGVLNDAAKARTVALNLPVTGIMGFLATAGIALTSWLARIARVHTVTVNTVQTGATGGGGGAAKYIQQFDTGTPYVMSSGLASIHEGEGIVPARGIQAGGALIKPTPSGFDVSGGGGGMVNSNNTVTIIATDRTTRQMLDELKTAGIDLERINDRDQRSAY